MKTRTLGIQLGAEDDNLYSSSYKVYYNSQYKGDEETVLGVYDTYKDKRSVAKPVSYYAGKQVFDSSSYPFPRYNNLKNLKIYACNYPLYMSRRYRNGMTIEYRYYRFPSGAYSPLEELRADWDGTGAAARRAWWTMQPRFEGDVSMLNFLFELKDFKDIVKHGMKFNYKNLKAEFKFLLKYFRRAARDPSKPLAQAHLTKEFALKPLIRDIKEIHAQLGQLVREVQADFEAQGHELQKTHYSENLAYEDNLTRKSSSDFNIYLGTQKQTKFTATMEYKYKYSMRPEMDAFLKYWGLNGSFEAYWNMVPFTFLVDYFIKIGDSFHAMETDPNVELLAKQYCESVLTQFDSGMFLVSHPNAYAYVVDGVYYNPQSAIRPVLTGGLRGTMYERRVTHPNRGLYIPRVSLPSFKQKQNMLALARCFL